jgi:hypothetical protein
LAMSMGSIIKFYNLYTKSPEEESVYGECFWNCCVIPDSVNGLLIKWLNTNHSLKFMAPHAACVLSEKD